MKKVMMICLLLAAGLQQTFAQKPALMISDKEGWHKIGETTVDFKTETDEIMPMGADRFEFIKFKVKDAPIQLVSLDIYYENGNKQSVTIGSDVKAEGESRTIKLDDKERNLKKIAFKYKTLSNDLNQKAHVELWGLKSAIKQ